ncbi:hypothetical protein LY78DRAFT_661988 [Colletotrichum sublineola]|nr:hypothetical protein LY78DRAFT_661988 [Colletotrichum sublineola]
MEIVYTVGLVASAFSTPQPVAQQKQLSPVVNTPIARLRREQQDRGGQQPRYNSKRQWHINERD